MKRPNGNKKGNNFIFKKLGKLLFLFIAIANQKGVGKTTTTVNLGIGLAQTGAQVLLVGADPQGSPTISLGYPEPHMLPFSLTNAIHRVSDDEAVNPGESILRRTEGVDLMPANIELYGGSDGRHHWSGRFLKECTLQLH